jgi:predicted polyphosphate/ATP-dependent NAD kinase
MIKNIGLIVNPIAGMGGKVGLKGTDGKENLIKAIKKGAVKESPQKTIRTLKNLKEVQDKIRIYTYSDEMGEAECLEIELDCVVLKEVGQSTYSKDTSKAAQDFLEKKVDLIVFSGGDGTARDIYDVIKDNIPVIGIPTGVKIHSAVFANNPENAALIIKDFVKENSMILEEREVIDIDEKDLKKDTMNPKLYGYMKVPYKNRLVQNLKSSGSNSQNVDSIAKYIIDNMDDKYYYIIGAGTTTRSIMTNLNLKYTLLGVDVVHKKKLIKKDANEKDLLDIAKKKKTKIIITPIGGQGFIFGRGNQQISSEIIKNVGKENITIISTSEKLLNIMHKPLLVDTGDMETDKYLKGVYKIVVGYDEYYAWRCS